MLRGVLAVGVWTAMFVVAACSKRDPDADCATYCEIQSACCATSPDPCRDNDDIPICTSTCRALAKDDEGYAAGIEDKARCFEASEDDCDQVLFGCLADGT